jgi:4-nitrophenyl phosphatase
MTPDFNPLRQIRCFLLDMDGTVYLGDHLLPGASAFLHLLDENHIRYLFLTNNSSKSKKEYSAKFQRLGLDISEESIYTSGEATAIYLANQKPGARVYLVGTPALEDEFVRHGFILSDNQPDFAVLGFDTTLTYNKIWRLCDLIVAGVPYIATHPDINCPTETGFMPDIGAMIEMIAASTGKRPDVIIGKPNSPIASSVADKLNLPVEAICMVGDRLYTDIALGQSGMMTVLVLGGETQPDQVGPAPIQPTFVMRDLAELTDILRQVLH